MHSPYRSLKAFHSKIFSENILGSLENFQALYNNYSFNVALKPNLKAIHKKRHNIISTCARNQWVRGSAQRKFKFSSVRTCATSSARGYRDTREMKNKARERKNDSDTSVPAAGIYVHIYIYTQTEICEERV